MLNNAQKKIFFFLLIVVCFGIIIFPFFTPVSLAILTAFLASFLYKKMLKKHSNAVALSITWLAILTTIILPIAIVGKVVHYQVTQELKYWDLSVTPESEVLPEEDTDIQTIQLNDFISEKQQEKILSVVEEKVTGIVSSIPVFIIEAILYLFLTTSLLMHGAVFREKIIEILPFDHKIIRTYVSAFESMVLSIVKGSFSIAFIQAILTTLSFLAVGIPFAGIVFILSFILYIPMFGTIVLYVPAAIFLIMQGSYLSAAFLLVSNALIIANLDNVLRGRFLPDDIQMDNSLLFLSIISGIFLFGLLGVIYGPLIAVAGLTSIDMYKSLGKK